MSPATEAAVLSFFIGQHEHSLNCASEDPGVSESKSEPGAQHPGCQQGLVDHKESSNPRKKHGDWACHGG